MFGISPIGWVHTLGSLPAIPVAIYMFARYGRIVPRSTAGIVYLVAMVIGSVSVLFVAKTPVAYVFAVLTLLVLGIGYGLARRAAPPGRAGYVETVCLSLSAFLLMLPTVTETLTRVPDGNPIAKAADAPIVLAAQATVLAVFVLGLTAQIILLRRHRSTASSGQAIW